MKTYKKRAKIGWSVGKGEKKSSNRSERNYVKGMLHNIELTSSDEERLSLDVELRSDEYERECFGELIAEGMIARDTLNPKEKKTKKKKVKAKSITSRIEYFQKKLDALKPDTFYSGWSRRYYKDNIKLLNDILNDKEKKT